MRAGDAPAALLFTIMPRLLRPESVDASPVYFSRDFDSRNGFPVPINSRSNEIRRQISLGSNTKGLSGEEGGGGGKSEGLFFPFFGGKSYVSLAH